MARPAFLPLHDQLHDRRGGGGSDDRQRCCGPFEGAMRMARFMICLLVVWLSAGSAHLVRAQEGQPPEQKPQDPSDAKKPPTPEHTGIHALFRDLGDDYKHLWSVDNAVVAGVGGAAALAVHPLDPTFNIHLRSHYTLVND